jgi:multiple RNA-binding domain-containing protein 1
MQKNPQGQAAANPKLAEFLELMKPRSVAKTYANDELAPANRGMVPADGQAAGRGDADGADENSNQSADDVMDEGVSDLEYLKRRMRPLGDTAEAGAAERGDRAAGGHGHEGREAHHRPAASAADASPSGRAHAAFDEAPAARIAQTGRLFIRNLPFLTTDDDVLGLCAPFGAVTDAVVVQSPATGKSKGFALVTFASSADAVAAHAALDASIFQGRLIHILPGNRPIARGGSAPGVDAGATDSPEVAGEAPAEQGEAEADTAAAKPAGSSFKAELEAQRKAEAGNRRAWSTFYMREDTVADAAAALSGVSKAELLGADSQGAAVGLALGEAQVCWTSLLHPMPG